MDAPAMSARLKRAWHSTAWQLGLLGLVALVLGAATGAWLGCLLAAALLAIGFGLHRIALLARALADRSHLREPGGNGILDELQAMLAARQRTARDEKRRLLGLLRAFRDAAAALPDAVIALDPDERIQWFNAATSRLLGLHYPQDVGAHLTNLVRAPRFAEWLRDGASETLTDLPSPADANLRLSVRLIRYADHRALLVVRDVSPLMRLEQVRRDFVANVSHELRTPLTVVHGYLDMIEPEQFPEYEPILHELRSQSRRMTQIVEDLLTLSRLESGTELPQERVAMRPMLEAMRREAEALSQGAHEIVAELRGVHDLHGSAKDLHSAFSNLVSNAVRYTPPGGRITLRWESGATQACLSVADTGNGIPAQHLPRLTERFYRVSTSRSRETGGTGLGLSIVKHVLQLHQAHLEIASEPGVGSTFSCVFDASRLLSPSAADLT
jgi:two-component system phosphate regulon sensor histidine kinase PhoR